MALVLTLTALASAPIVSTAAAVPPSEAGSETLPAALESIVFGAVGDFDNKAPSYPDMAAEAKRFAARGGMFLLGLGDLGYTADEANWCGTLTAAVPDVAIVAGNHDAGESSGGNISKYVVYCPFTLNATLVAGPGTPGYGYEYYFDYPRVSPLARFILVVPGIRGTINYDYAAGSAHHNWVVDAVNGARTAGIPWVVVGMHKLCINAGSYGCEIGKALFDQLVDLKVDLILHGHYHSYQRSKQLALGANCTTIPSDGNFDADCIVQGGSHFAKGRGTIVAIDGAGGRDVYAIPLNGSDPELGYFTTVMGSTGNTQNRSVGHGPLIVTLNATALTGSTAMCPLGTGDLTTGECPSHAPNTYQDSFEISSTAIPPPPLVAGFTSDPPDPLAGDVVTFHAYASGGTPPHSFQWGFGDGTTGSGVDVGHAYAASGNYTVVLTVTDSGLQRDTAQAVVVVGGSSPPVEGPATSHAFSGTRGSGEWFVTPVLVNLTTTSPSSPVVTTWYRLDNGTWQNYSEPFTVGEGRHTLEYRATDGLGNTETAHVVSVAIDSVPPHVSVAPSGGVETVSPVVVSWNLSDDGSGVWDVAMSVDGAALEPLGTRTSTTLALADGEHTVAVRATDVAGNAGWANVTFRVDTNAFSPTGPLKGMPTYELIAVGGALVVFFALRHRARVRRMRRTRVRMGERGVSPVRSARVRASAAGAVAPVSGAGERRRRRLPRWWRSLRRWAPRSRGP